MTALRSGLRPSSALPEAEKAKPEEVLRRSLAESIRSGDVSAFAVLLDRYWQPLVTYAEEKLESRDAAEDAVQEAYVRVWVKREGLRTDAFLRGYLYRAVHNLAVDELRKRRVRSRHASALVVAAASPPRPDQMAEAEELAEAADRAIRALPERRRDVFVLGHFHELSYREIAETLGMTPRTVANHMSLALRDLRIALRPFLPRAPDTQGPGCP
jgi:RNA polymerase sigma-70 factor, ECF subfamily